MGDGRRGSGRPGNAFGSFRVLRHRNFALVASGAFVNGLGMWARIIGIGWAARELSDSPTMLGIAFGAQFLPSLFLAPIGGLVADRYDRRLVGIAGNLGMAVPTIAIAVLLRTGSLTITLLVALAFLGGVLQSFTQPATMALIPTLVPLDEVKDAVALNSVSINVSRFLGAALIGGVIAAFGTASAFELNAAAFLVVVALWLPVRLDRTVDRSDDPQTEPFLRKLAAGLRFARTHRAVGSLLVLNVAATFLIMQQPLLPLVASDVLDAGPSAYGLLNSATGLGAVVGALFAARFTTDAGRRGVIAVALLTTAGSVMAISVSRWVAVSVGLQVVFGAGFFVMATTTTTIITLSTPDNVRGRVMGLHSMSVAGVVPLNSFAAGVLASRIGTSTTILVAGAVLLAYSGWFIARGLPAIGVVVAGAPTRTASG